MTHPNPQDETTPAAATGSHSPGAPQKNHGDPLLAASQGAIEGTDGSRHGLDSDALEQQD
jgi:hypothetical protein